jgi:hypothetical protein
MHYPFVSIRFWIMLVGCLSYVQMLAQPSADSSLYLPLFEEDEVLNLSLQADMKALFKDIEDERSYHPAMLSYKNEEGDSVQLTVKLKTRGHFRRDRSHCNCPPIRLNVKKKQVIGTVFEGQDKIKLVTHCQNKRDSYEEHVIHEYFIYRAYNLFTPYSFRVRLLRLTYLDSSGSFDPMTKYAFLIEDEDHVAERNQGKVLKDAVIHPDKGHRFLTNQLCVFQYLIGNTDFSIGYQHNVRLLETGPFQPPIPVPYDFDWSGLVQAPYARPNPKLELGSVTQRLFRGFCRSEEEFEEGFKPFRENREALFALYDELPGLSEKTREKKRKYLEDFFEIIDNPKKVKREFLRRCR